MVIVVMIIAGLNASSQGNGYCYCEKCFLHVDFLLRFAHGDGMCAQKVLTEGRTATLTVNENLMN